MQALDSRHSVVHGQHHWSLIFDGHSLGAGSGRHGSHLHSGKPQSAGQSLGAQDWPIQRKIPVGGRVEIGGACAGGP